MAESGHNSQGDSGRWGFKPSSGVRQRLGTYLIGIALGCVIAGMLVMLHHQQAQREAAQQQQQEQQAAPPASAPKP